MLLKLIYNWIYVKKNVLVHARTKADYDSDLSDLHTVLYIQGSFHILITLAGSPLLLLCAILIIIVLHFCSLKLALLPVLCGDC